MKRSVSRRLASTFLVVKHLTDDFSRPDMFVSVDMGLSVGIKGKLQP